MENIAIIPGSLDIAYLGKAMFFFVYFNFEHIAIKVV